MRPGELFDGPRSGGVLGGSGGPVEVEAPVQERLLVLGQGGVVEVGLVAGVAGVAVAVDLYVVESPRHDLAGSVDLASVGDGVVQVDEQARIGRGVVLVDQHRPPPQRRAEVGHHLVDHRGQQRRAR